MLYSKLGPDRCIEVIGLRWFAPMLYGQTTDKTELKTDPFPACSQSGRRCNQIRQINVVHPASIGLVQEQLSSQKPTGWFSNPSIHFAFCGALHRAPPANADLRPSIAGPIVLQKKGDRTRFEEKKLAVANCF